MIKYTDSFCLKNERSFCNAKASHIFSTKMLTNDDVSFEQPGPVVLFGKQLQE